MRAFNSKRSFFILRQWCKWVTAVSQQQQKTSQWRWHTCLCMRVCVSTCRPPILSQVLPRAHSASQGSVVAVHRMQDLQQLSRSRKECGEWMSEYGRLAAKRCLWTLSSLLKCQIEMLIDMSVVLGLSYFSHPQHDFTLCSYLSDENHCYSNVCWEVWQWDKMHNILLSYTSRMLVMDTGYSTLLGSSKVLCLIKINK